MTGEEVIKAIHTIGVVPCIRTSTVDNVQFAAESLLSVGLSLVEIAVAQQDSPQMLDAVARNLPGLVVGAGTILDVETARRCVDAGAKFLTSPGFNPDVVKFAKTANVVVCPGAMTPSEILAAWRSGADFVKIFPVAMAGGAAFVRALRFQVPQIPLIVSGGVNQLTAFDYICAGASAIGLGEGLIPRRALANRERCRIQELGRRFRGLVEQARGRKLAVTL